MSGTRRKKAELADKYADEMMRKVMQMQERGESVGAMVRNIAWHYAMLVTIDDLKLWLEMHGHSEERHD